MREPGIDKHQRQVPQRPDEAQKKDGCYLHLSDLQKGQREAALAWFFPQPGDQGKECQRRDVGRHRTGDQCRVDQVPQQAEDRTIHPDQQDG